MQPAAPNASQTYLQKIRSKIKLSFYISLVVGITTSLSLLVFGYLSLNILRENKIRDIVMILHYDADYLSKQLAHEFQVLNERVLSGQLSKRSYKIIAFDSKTKKFKNIKGLTKSYYSSSDLGLPPEGPALKIHLISIDGSQYWVKKREDLPWITETMPTNSLILFDFSFGILASALQKNKEETLTYLVSQNGNLLFSNSPTITQDSLGQRSLIQKFAESPLESMQLKFQDPIHGDTYGFFSSIEETNLMLFSETTQKVITKKIDKIRNNFIFYALGILLAAIVFLHIGMTTVYATLHHLAEYTKKISSGDFNVNIKLSSFGELNALTKAFASMTQSLIKRDDRIKVLIEKERKGALIQMELGIAREIQNSFLPKPNEKTPPSLSVVSYYMPAGFVAGDWYGIHHDEDNSKFYVIIADVSGHGAGASMYTAMIAALFEQAREDNFSRFSIAEFFHKINNVLIKIGKRQWHSSMQCLEFLLKENKVIITNAGHPYPIYFKQNGNEIESKLVGLRSDLLGLSTDFHLTQKEIPIERGDGFFMYTDGLIEARNEKGRQFSTRRLMKLIRDHRNKTSHNLLDMVKKDLISFTASTKTDDDVCLVSLRYTG